MNQTVLFTPIGGTDPISETNYHDGAMLHIARHYKPDKIYMYLSQEILEKQEKDDRYRKCIEFLGERLNHTFTVYEIEKPELVNVHLFDPIYAEFQKVLSEIMSQMDITDTLLLNISSGTPAMKSALLVIKTMIDLPCKCIQVDTPTKSMNEHRHEELFTPEDMWEADEDNLLSPDDEEYNRTRKVVLHSLQKLKYEETIKKYLSTYNYHAAVLLAENMDDTDAYLDKLKLADAREQLDKYEVNRLLKKGENAEIYRPVSREDARDIYEYTLALQAKAARGEYADFIRALSPIMTVLYMDILKNEAKFDIKEYTFEGNSGKGWNRKKLKNDYREIYEMLVKKKRDNLHSSNNSDYAEIIKELIQNAKLKECMKKLRNVEAKIRNPAAHTIVRILDEDIKKGTGISSCEIIDLIQIAFSYSSFNIKKSQWTSYDDMNADILNAMNNQ